MVAELVGVDECIAGATAILSQGGKEIGRQVTDVFGDFKFDDLEPGSGIYSVQIQHPDLGLANVTGLVDDSCYLGEVRLS